MIPRPTLRHIGWALWLERFADPPSYDQANLAWSSAHIAERLAAFPDVALLNATERSALVEWIEAYRDDFTLESEEPVRIVDPLAGLGLVSGLGGLLSLGTQPLFAAACFVAGSILLIGGAFNQLDLKDRREHTKAIKRQLNALLRKLKQ